MKRIVILAALAALTVVPNALAGPTASSSDRAQAVSDCQKLRPSLNENVGARTFGKAFGTAQQERADAFRNCLTAFKAEAHQSRHAAVEACETATAESTEPNAFGQCVAAAMRAESRADRRDTLNAAQTCKAERETLGGDAFAAKYGTNANDRNAYGKCVSTLARAEDGETPTEV